MGFDAASVGDGLETVRRFESRAGKAVHQPGGWLGVSGLSAVGAALERSTKFGAIPDYAGLDSLLGSFGTPKQLSFGWTGAAEAIARNTIGDVGATATLEAAGGVGLGSAFGPFLEQVESQIRPFAGISKDLFDAALPATRAFSGIASRPGVIDEAFSARDHLGSGFVGTAISQLAEMKRRPVYGPYESAWNSYGGAVPFFDAGGVTTKGLEIGSIMGSWPGAQGIFEELRRGWDFLAPCRERWKRLAEELAEWAARQAAESTPEDRLAAAAFEALEALEDGRHWETKRFLEQHLNIRPNPRMAPYVYHALWLLLRADFDRPFGSPAKWRTLDLRAATAYLSTAIYNRARRLKRDSEMQDRLWWPGCGEGPVLGWDPRWQAADGSEDPAYVVISALEEPTPDQRTLVLDGLSLKGTDRDRAIVRLVRAGEHDRAGIRNEVGSPTLQAFERKARRWRADGNY